MEEIKNWLKDYGLNETETEVFLCILKNPGTKVADIQKHSGLVRTTIYYCLAQLKSDGLISENVQNNIKTYRAAKIENLHQNIELKIGEEKRKLETLETLKPLFNSLQASPATKETFVSHYEGIKAVKQAIEEALRCNSKRWLVIASRDNFLYHTSKQYQKYYLSERKRRGIISKTLWEPVAGFDHASIEDVFYRNPRLLPAEFRGAFNSLVILYDDVTLVVDPYEQMTAYAIHDATSTQLMKLMFNSIWSSSSGLKPKTKQSAKL